MSFSDVVPSWAYAPIREQQRHPQGFDNSLAQDWTELPIGEFTTELSSRGTGIPPGELTQ
jgi:hypothetical protein